VDNHTAQIYTPESIGSHTKGYIDYPRKNNESLLAVT